MLQLGIRFTDAVVCALNIGLEVTKVTQANLGHTVSTSDNSNTIGRRTFLGSLILGASAIATPSWAATPALVTGKGNFRALALDNERTSEWMNTVYWADGEYIPDAMESLNYILRDWRQEKEIQMDPTAIDILSAAKRLLETDEPFRIVSGYRTPETNRMLRKRSRGVAKNSYHIKGMAIDVALKSRSVAQIARAGHALRAGGVGIYTRSNFVHLDSGPVRSWGR